MKTHPEAPQLSLKEEILSPLFFDEDDLKPEHECTPLQVIRERRFGKLLGKASQSALPLFERILEKDATLEPHELRLAATYLEKALLRWHKKMPRLERKVKYDESTGNEQPFSTQDLGRIITNAAKTLLLNLKELGYEFHQDPELASSRFNDVWEKIEAIRTRLCSVVLYENTPTSGGPNRDLGNISGLAAVGNMEIPKNYEAALYFGGSKRSDIAACTNGETLLSNLKNLHLSPKDFELITLRFSGNPLTMVAPRGSQGIVGLKDLFAEVGVIPEDEEVEKKTDIFFLGLPDEAFHNVEGIVQDGDGKQKKVSGGYKRFHALRHDGSAVYAVGRGKDSSGKDLDYFGPFKKSWQLVATRQLQNATQLLSLTGRKVAQPTNPELKFRYYEGERRISDNAAILAMVMPFHGTSLFWGTPEASTAEIAQRLKNNETVNHTIFEGQSGMGKSEMEQFIRMIISNLRDLHQTLSESEDQNLRRLASGLTPVTRLRLYSAGDDMGQLEVNEWGELKARTHEKGRFTRLDNIPSREGISARKTEPIDERGTVVSTSNTRVIEEDRELEAFHQIPSSTRIFVLASNMPLPVENVNPEKPVQEVDFETYMECYAKYQNTPNGTKDTNDPVMSPGAMHEFMGQFAQAGGAACENAVAVRRFMLEHEMKRRKDCHVQRNMRFYIMNTGIKPGWMEEQDLSESEKQKIAFANTARHWMDVEGLLPSEIRGAFIHAEKILGLNLGELAYRTENWSKSKIHSFLSKQTQRKKEEMMETARG